MKTKIILSTLVIFVVSIIATAKPGGEVHHPKDEPGKSVKFSQTDTQKKGQTEKEDQKKETRKKREKEKKESWQNILIIGGR